MHTDAARMIHDSSARLNKAAEELRELMVRGLSIMPYITLNMDPTTRASRNLLLAIPKNTRMQMKSLIGITS